MEARQGLATVDKSLEFTMKFGSMRLLVDLFQRLSNGSRESRIAQLSRLNARFHCGLANVLKSPVTRWG